VKNEESYLKKFVKATALSVGLLIGAQGAQGAEAGKEDMFKELDLDNESKNYKQAFPNEQQKSGHKEDIFSDMDTLEGLQKKYNMANKSERDAIRKEMARVLIIGGRVEQKLKEGKTINLISGDVRVMANLVENTVVGVVNVGGEISEFKFSLK